MPKRCDACGFQMSDGVDFCPNCGKAATVRQQHLKWVWVAVLAAVLICLYFFVFLPNLPGAVAYRTAEEYMEEGDYLAALQYFRMAGDYKDSREQARLLQSCADRCIALGDGTELAMGLKKDGTVLLEPWDPETKKAVPDTSRWHDIVAVYNGYALKADGTVAAVSERDQAAVARWRDVREVYPYLDKVLGLGNNGRLLFSDGDTPLLDEFRQQLQEAEPFVLLGRPADPVTMNTGMTGAADGYYSVIGVPQSTGQPEALRPSAPYSFYGDAFFGASQVQDVVVALDVAVALLEDGRVIATDGFNFFDDTPSNYTIRLDTSFSEELETWKDIASIAVLPRELEEGGSLVIGVKNDGTLVHTGNSFYSFSGWEDIASVYPTYNGSALVGLKFDGSLVVWNADGVPNAIFGWERIGIPEAAVAYRNGQAADPYMLEPGTAAGGENPEEPESEPQPQPEEEDEPAVETMDYGMFLGAAWIDTANVNIQSVYDRGGTILNIEAFAGNTMRFTLTRVSAGRKRIAEVRGECELEDGIGTADFEDDGWGNAGTLTFVFSEHGGITVTPVITRAGEGANWYIGASPVKLYAAGAEAGYTGPLEHEQRVTVTARGSSAEVSLEIWNGGDWEKRLTASGTVGSNGIAENISEGSMMTPQGTFDLGFAFGVDPVETNLDFKTVRPDTYWVDDPASAYYNMWQNGTAGRDWDSAEALYPQFTEGNMRHCIVIEFNGDGLSSDGVRPGCGSVIFLCGRAGSLSSTYGDVYIPEADMLTLLSYLDETKEPVIQIQ